MDNKTAKPNGQQETAPPRSGLPDANRMLQAPTMSPGDKVVALVFIASAAARSRGKGYINPYLKTNQPAEQLAYSAGARNELDMFVEAVDCLIGSEGAE